jgi:endonuclease-3
MPPRKPSSRRLEDAPAAAGVASAANPVSVTAQVKPKAKAKRASGPKAPKPLEPASVEALFSRFQQAEPEPKGELEHVNPYTLLVAVVLSAQATDAGVNKATRPLFSAVDTPQKMIDLGEDRLREAIKTIGLFRNKAKNVIALSQRLVAEYGGEVPRERAVLETLPGVGRKTANVVLNMAFGEPTIAVDTHLFRVSNRIPLAPGKTPLAVELGLEKIIPRRFMLHAHHWLILHGRYVCKARKPECWRCLVADLCRFEPKSTPGKPMKGTQGTALRSDA